MSLTDARIVDVSNAVLRVLGLPPNAEIGSDDGEFVFVATTTPDGEDVVGSQGIVRGASASEAAVQLLDGLTNDISETSAFWGVAFPRCPGHDHPADYAADGDAVVLRCPADGRELVRVTP
ncbi:hypothetical protein [Jatrophihabitans fulvus]